MEPPVFLAPLATVRAAPGASALLHVPQPAGTQPFQFEWSHAGASLDDRFTSSEDAGGVRLTVSAARIGDSGVYTLQASNAAGRDTARVRLEVAADEAPTGDDPPTFLRRLQDLTVKVGTRTRFLVEIVSSTECKVTWYRNERRLMEAERVSLVRDGTFWCADIAAVSVDDTGRWTCTAENAGGRASCSAHLNVLVPKAYKRPEFVEELRALLTEQGTVSLECKVVGVPTPVLRWFKDSREIKAGDVFALTANAEDPTSLGTYTCEAVNCMGRAYSSSKVHVVGRGSREGSIKPITSGVTPESPPIFTKELEDKFVRISEPLTLGCHIVVPPWPRSVVWYNKEGKVEPGDRYHVVEDGVGGYMLEVPSAEWPDEGEWKCVATSSGGRIGFSSCYVSMDVPKNYRKPRFMENLQAVLTEEGLVSFECKVVGFPTPVLSWFKDGQELKPGDVYQLTGTNSLGSYCCIARNCMGQASSSAELTVEDIQNQLNEEEKLQLFSKNQAPKFVQGLKSVEAKIDEPFRFTIKVAIPPEPSVQWYRDDQPVDDSPRCHLAKEERGVFYLDIQSLEFLDQAEWKCVAVNDFGHSVTSCFLKLTIPRHYKKPRFLENLQAILSDEGAVNLECKVIGVPQPVLKWYKDGEELKPGDIHRIISGQDGTCCLGTYTCEAQNCMGIAASSASLLGFDDSVKAKATKKKAEEQTLQRNVSLSTIHEERSSQMYDTPVGDITLDDKAEISFSFDGKEVSVSLYETPDLTEEDAIQIMEMYADQISENVTEHNVAELPPLRFVKETSTSGNLLMEAIIIDVSPEYFASHEDDLRTEADIEDISIADENGPPQLSLDQDIGGEDYLEKTMDLLSNEKADIVPKKMLRKKSDSQRSADDFFSLSMDQTLSEDKKDDDTQILSESFASAHSLGKPKSKSSKPSLDEGQESSDLTKTILVKEEVQKQAELETPIAKPKRERRSSRGSRRSSSGSEKSFGKSRDETPKPQVVTLEQVPKKPSMTNEEFKTKMTNVSSSLSKVINDVQIIERDIILKSELMSSAATASRSLEIISSLIKPLSEIHSIADAARESTIESKEVSSTLFSNLSQPLKVLQQSLTIIEKCIDVESDNKTLVKKTCVAFIETCGEEVKNLMSEIVSVTDKDYLLTEQKTLSEISSLVSDMNNVIRFSADTIKTRNLLSEASEIKASEANVEAKHLRDTQKAVFELKSPLNSLLRIVDTADEGKVVDVTKIKSSEVIINDMSASVQDLQAALEQIESLSVRESSSSLHKYNTEIIETVMESVLKLRGSFEQLSIETKNEDDKDVLKQALESIKNNLSEISSHIMTIERNVGSFDILQSENKLEMLQKMAQILISLENNLPRLEIMPEVKIHMDVFHKNLTRVLENVIESNEASKYFSLIEICDAVNRLNASIKTIDADSVLALASLSNTIRIIQDSFVKNVFDSELNCSILTNINDTLVSVEEALIHVDEISLQMESELIQDISTPAYDLSKANAIVEHIEHTIAVINTVKLVEMAPELKTTITPVLESISPVLEDLKRNIASVKPSDVRQEEHISEISDASSVVKTLATPLLELNQNLLVLSQVMVENIESFKENSEVMTAIAEPLHELHTTLQVLQQDVISQFGEDVTPYDVSVNIVSAVQNLQSCILMIQDQPGVEGVDEMSTLEDISGIKTTADTIPSDRLVLPAAEETAIEISVEPFSQEIVPTATAKALQTLNEHITILQTPEVIDALDTLSEVSDYSSLKSVALGLGELHAGIEEILHPFIMEDSDEIANLINTSKLAAIAEPMQELQQSLSVLDISNIPIYEHILEIPTEKIHFVLESISSFKEYLSKCVQALFPAMETADKTIEISNKVEVLREVCENLKVIIETTKDLSPETPVKQEVITLEETINSLLDATDVNKGIQIQRVKAITEELFEKIMTVQEDFIQYTPLTAQKITEEAKLIQAFDEIENNIAVLEQYDFVDLSRASEITSCATPTLAMEMESEPLIQMDDILQNAVNVIQDSAKETPIADLMILEDFFKTCKSEFTIIRLIISKPLSHKKIIRLIQEFVFLQNVIKDFKLKRSELQLSDDIDGYLKIFFLEANGNLKIVQDSLLKLINAQSDILFTGPLAKLENLQELLVEIRKNKVGESHEEIIMKMTEVIEVAKPTLQKANIDLTEELTCLSGIVTVTNTTPIVEKIEEFLKYTEEQTQAFSVKEETKEVLVKITACLQKHQDYKDATGTGKTLIILKCLSECSEILQASVLEKKSIVKKKIEDHALKAVLSEMLEPLQALHGQLTNIQEQVASGIEEKSISIDITTTESMIEAVSEIHRDIVEQIESAKSPVSDEEMSLILEADKEIHAIQESFKSLEQVPVVQELKAMAKPIEEVEKSMQNIISLETTVVEEEELPKDVNSNIDSLENAIERFLNIEIDLLTTSELFDKVDFNKCLLLADKIKACSVLASEELNNPDIIEMKTKHVSALKDTLCEFDWLNTDKYLEGKNQSQREKLKRIFLTTYQLLIELGQIESKRKMSDPYKFTEKTAVLLQHIDQYIELLDIVEEKSSVIKVKELTETAQVARELRSEIAISESEVSTSISKEDVDKKQADLAIQLQNSLSNLNIQVLENVKDLASELNTDLLKKFANVTGQLQTDLAIVTGLETSILSTQLKTEEIKTDMTEKVLKKSDKTVAIKTTTTDKLPDTEKIVVEEKTKDKVLEASSEEEVTSAVTTPVMAEPVENAQQLVIEQTKPIETTDISKGTLTSISSDALQTAVETTIVSKLEDQKIEINVSEMLKQSIEEFIREDLSGSLNKLSAVIDIEELKQTVHTAKELSENIVIIENISTTTPDDLDLEREKRKQVDLVQQLQNALSTVQEQIFDNYQQLESVFDTSKLQKVADVTLNLQSNLVAAISEISTSSEINEAKALKEIETVVEKPLIPTVDEMNKEMTVKITQEQTEVVNIIQTEQTQPIKEKDTTAVHAESTSADVLKVASYTEPIKSEFLKQTISEFISEDLSEVINNLATVINVEQLKQTVDFAKELRENIAAVENVEGTLLEANSAVFNSEKENQAQLVQNLQSALLVVQEQIFENYQRLETICDASKLQKIADITVNLQTQLATVVTSATSIKEDKSFDSDSTMVPSIVSEAAVALEKPEDIKNIHIAEQKADKSLIEPEQTSVVTAIQSVQDLQELGKVTEGFEQETVVEQVQTVITKGEIKESSLVTEVKLENVESTGPINEVVPKNVGETVEVEKETVVIQDIKPVVVDSVSVCVSETSQEAQAIESREAEFKKPSIETIIQNIEAYISSNKTQVIRKLSDLVKLDEYEKSLKLAAELKENIAVFNIKTVLEQVGFENKPFEEQLHQQASLVQQLINSLDILTIQIQKSETEVVKEVKTIISDLKNNLQSVLIMHWPVGDQTASNIDTENLIKVKLSTEKIYDDTKNLEKITAFGTADTNVLSSDKICDKIEKSSVGNRNDEAVDNKVDLNVKPVGFALQQDGPKEMQTEMPCQENEQSRQVIVSIDISSSVEENLPSLELKEVNTPECIKEQSSQYIEIQNDTKEQTKTDEEKKQKREVSPISDKLNEAIQENETLELETLQSSFIKISSSVEANQSNEPVFEGNEQSSYIADILKESLIETTSYEVETSSIAGESPDVHRMLYDCTQISDTMVSENLKNVSEKNQEQAVTEQPISTTDSANALKITKDPKSVLENYLDVMKLSEGDEPPKIPEIENNEDKIASLPKLEAIEVEDKMSPQAKSISEELIRHPVTDVIITECSTDLVTDTETKDEVQPIIDEVQQAFEIPNFSVHEQVLPEEEVAYIETTNIFEENVINPLMKIQDALSFNEQIPTNVKIQRHTSTVEYSRSGDDQNNITEKLQLVGQTSTDEEKLETTNIEKVSSVQSTVFEDDSGVDIQTVLEKQVSNDNLVQEIEKPDSNELLKIEQKPSDNQVYDHVPATTEATETTQKEKINVIEICKTKERAIEEVFAVDQPIDTDQAQFIQKTVCEIIKPTEIIETPCNVDTTIQEIMPSKDLSISGNEIIESETPVVASSKEQTVLEGIVGVNQSAVFEHPLPIEKIEQEQLSETLDDKTNISKISDNDVKNSSTFLEVMPSPTLCSEITVFESKEVEKSEATRSDVETTLQSPITVDQPIIQISEREISPTQEIQEQVSTEPKLQELEKVLISTVCFEDAKTLKPAPAMSDSKDSFDESHIGSGDLHQHIEAFVSDDIVEAIEELAVAANMSEVKEAVVIAKELLESISVESQVRLEDTSVLAQASQKQQAELKEKLNEALTTLQTKVLDATQDIAPLLPAEKLERISEVATHLQEDLTTASVTQMETLVSEPGDLHQHIEAFVSEDVVEAIEELAVAANMSEVKEVVIIAKELLESISVESQVRLEVTSVLAQESQKQQAELKEKLNEALTTLQTKVLDATQDIAPLLSAEKLERVSKVVTHLQEDLTTASVTKMETLVKEPGDLHQHIEAFVSEDVVEAIEELAAAANMSEAKEAVVIAKELLESISVESQVRLEDTSILDQESQKQQAELKDKLNEALTTLQTKVLDATQDIAPLLPAEKLERISELVTHLQEDLTTASVTEMETLVSELITETSKEESMKQLENLLQEVSDKIDLSSSERVPEDNEALRDSLDEVQTVIIKLKRDFDGANDTLNETLDDLECSVRSVQLQINEDSPPELLKEACATLHLLVNNMSETNETCVSETITKDIVLKDVLDKCSSETEQTVQLLEIASNVDFTAQKQLGDIITNLSKLTETMKSLKAGFTGNAETLIEKGTDIIQSLNQLEDKVFSIEKEIESVKNLSSNVRDNIITAVHSVYGSISNMRSTVASTQKQYMFENYGQPSENFLRSIKQLSTLSKTAGEETDKTKCKKLSKSLRNALNHFEDIKFYINLDKTARLPSDAAFTKIILEDLKSNIQILSTFDGLTSEVKAKIKKSLKCVKLNLQSIEVRSTLEVKEKIPIFKVIAAHVLDVTNGLKFDLEKKVGQEILVLQEEGFEQIKLEESVTKLLSDTNETPDIVISQPQIVEQEAVEAFTVAPEKNTLLDTSNLSSSKAQGHLEDAPEEVQLAQVVQKIDVVDDKYTDATPSTSKQAIEEITKLKTAQGLENEKDRTLSVEELEADDTSSMQEHLLKDNGTGDKDYIETLSEPQPGTSKEENKQTELDIKKLETKDNSEGKQKKKEELEEVDLEKQQFETKASEKKEDEGKEALQIEKEEAEAIQKQFDEQVQIQKQKEEEEIRLIKESEEKAEKQREEEKQDQENKLQKIKEDAEKIKKEKAEKKRIKKEKERQDAEKIRLAEEDRLKKEEEIKVQQQEERKAQKVEEVILQQKENEKVAKTDAEAELIEESKKIQEEAQKQKLMVVTEDETLVQDKSKEQRSEKELEEADKQRFEIKQQEEERLQKEETEIDIKRKQDEENVTNETEEKKVRLNAEETKETEKISIEEEKMNNLDKEQCEEESERQQNLKTFEIEQLKQETLEKERSENERIQKEQAEKDKQEKERFDKERKEKLEEERIAKEKVEQEKEQLAKENQEKLEREEKEKLEKDRKEKEEQEKEVAAKQKEELERIEKEKVEKVKKEQERLDLEKLEKERKEKQEQERLEKEKLENERKETEKQEQERLEKEKLENERKETEKQEQERLEKEKMEKELKEKEKQEQERLKMEMLENERKETEKQEQERLEKEKLENERKETEKQEQERLEKEKMEKKLKEKEKQEQERLNMEKLENERKDTEKQEQERLEKEKLEKECIEKEKQEQERLEKEKLENERKEKEKQEQKRLKKEKLEKEKLEQERLEMKKLEKERKEKEKLEQERLEKEKLEKEKLEQERLEMEKLEKERKEKEKLEQERLEKEKLEKEKLEQERLEMEKLEKKRKEKEKLEQERQEKEKLEKERKEKEEQDRLEVEKLEKERKEEEKQEQERLEKEKLENKRKEKEKLEQERLEKVKLEKERKEQEKQEQERLEIEKLEKERKEKEKLEQERLEKEKLEKKRKEKEKQEQERLEKEKLERERKEKEKQEQERLEKEKLERERKEKEKQEQERLENEKLEKELKEKEKQEQERLEMEKLEKKRQEKEKLEQERLAKEKLEKERKEKEKQEQERLEGEKLEKERKEKEKQERKLREMQEQELLEKEKAEKEKQERLEKAKLDKERIEKEKAEKEKQELNRLENEKLENEKVHKEKLEQERKEKEKLEKEQKEKAEKEKQEQKRLEIEKLEKEKVEKEKIEQIRKDKEKAEKQKQELSEKENQEKVRIEKEKAEKEVKERERVKKETEVKQEQERLVKEKLETEKQERDKGEKERKEKERIDKEKMEQEQAEKAKLDKENLELKLNTEKIEKENMKKEAQDAETKRLDKEKTDREARLLKDQKESDKAKKEKTDRKRLKKGKDEDKEKSPKRKSLEGKKTQQDEKTNQKLSSNEKLDTDLPRIDNGDIGNDNKKKKKRVDEDLDKRKRVSKDDDISTHFDRTQKTEEYQDKTDMHLTEISKIKLLDEKEIRAKETIDVDYSRKLKSETKLRSDRELRTHDESHHIKEYYYEPSLRPKHEDREKPRFIDHNHRDYTMEFARPSAYREKTFEVDNISFEKNTGRGHIYKANTLMMDAQLRSSAPPRALPDTSRSSEPIERRPETKQRSKALSEARSILTEKRPASRDIRRKPVFSTYLTDRTAVEGSRVKLTCSVLSSTDPKVTWYKNGVILDNKLKYRTKLTDGLITLEVLNAVPSDSAEYSCTVENENGSVNTSANLKVYPSFEASPIPPTFTRSIRDTYHLAENELVLECRIRGQPLPTITWLKDDRQISTNDRYQAYYLADGVCRLAINHPTPEDSGKYTCKAENSVWSDQITHIVNFTGKESRLSPNITTIERSRFNRQALESSRRPHFSNVLTDYKVTTGGTIGLQVEIRGAPTRVEWLREGRSVIETYSNAKTYVEQGLYTLALSDVTEKESGLYTCRAWSSHGTVDMNAAITVVHPNEMEGKPAIIAGRPEKDVLISVGEDLNISFRAQGEPKPKVVFMKGIRDITNSQRVCKMTSDDYVKFTVKRSVISDAGTYCILVRNAYGCDRAFVTVAVRQRASSENLISDWTYPIDDSALSITERKFKSVPERIPGEPTVVDGGNNWLSLAWPKPDPGEAAPVLAYKIESWLAGKEGGARWTELGITPLNSFDAFNLKQGEEYHFRVTPRNIHGWGEAVQTTSPIGVGLAGDRPEFLDILPGQLKVLIGETANLSCSVKGKPIPEVVWMKNGHEIEEDKRVKTSFNGFNCNLTIEGIDAEDEARYSCEASNVHGRASTYARLAVVTDRLIWEADAKLKRERSEDAAGDYPPQFTMRLRDRRVQATYPVRLTCQVVGSPAPTITWFKDGEEVTLDTRHTKSQDEHFHTLEIAPTTLEDGGVYEAMARNSSGAISCHCSLVVDKGIRAYVAPEFCCGLEPLYRLNEGEELRISAVVEAYPTVGVTWYRDGVRLRPSRRAIMTLDRDGQIELALAFVTPRDAGVYTCTASNEVGRASTSGKVEVIEGEATAMKKRTPPMVISPDVPYSKEPMFIRKPRSSEAWEGDTVIIQCEVVGDPKPDVYWLRDFLKPDYYRDATHFKRVGDGPEYRFEIPHAKLDYTGAYSVVARNVHGEAKAIISLQILARDPSSTEEHYIRYGRVDVIPRFERDLTDLLCHDGDAIEFECHVSGHPEPDIRWFHYTELIRECPDFEWSLEDGTARLKIKQVTAEDEGTYLCEASNNLGKATSSACLVVYPPGEPNTLSQRLRRPPALLSGASTPRSTPRSTPARSVSRTPGPDPRRLCSPSRQMPPKFYTYPFNKVVEEGDHVVFQCAVKGLPAPWATWDKDGVIITPSSRVTIKEKDEILRILEIEEVTVEDVGVYRVTLENDYGRVEASARLEVITQKGKFYAGVRAYSPSPRKSLPYRRRTSSSRQD